MSRIELSPAEIRDLITAIGGKLPDKRVLGEGFTGNQRLALRARLEAIVSEQEEADG